MRLNSGLQAGPRAGRSAGLPRRFFNIVALGLLAGLAVGCSRQPAGPGKPVIAASIYPLANLVQQMVGDAAEVVSVVPPGVNPHGFELNAAGAAALHHARLIVRVGMGFDDWARPAALQPHQRMVTMANLLGMEADSRPLAPLHAHHPGDDEGDETGPNPHLWVDPVLTREFVEKLTPILTEAFPEQRAGIESRSAKLVAELKQLDEEFRRELAPYKGQPIVTFHNAFNRLAERYGLQVAATLAPIEAPGTLTFSSAQKAIERIRDRHIRAVFTEPIEPAAAQVVQQATGVPVLFLDDLGDPGDPERSSYQALMRYNLRSLVKGLSGK